MGARSLHLQVGVQVRVWLISTVVAAGGGGSRGCVALRRNAGRGGDSSLGGFGF